MTPFASGALSRGLTALLVSCVRLQGTEFNANKKASRIDRNHPFVKEAIETIVRRAELVGTRRRRVVRVELEGRVERAARPVAGRGPEERRAGGCSATTRSGTESRWACSTGRAWSRGTISPA